METAKTINRNNFADEVLKSVFSKDSFSVTVRREHTINTVYESCTDCALCRAIREQIQQVLSVGGTYVRAKRPDIRIQ